MKSKFLMALLLSLCAASSGCALLRDAVEDVRVEVVNESGEQMGVKDVEVSMDEGVLGIRVTIEEK